MPTLFVSETERQWARQFLASNCLSPEDVVVGVHPGASVARKRWPLERFAEVARTLGSRPGVRVLAFVDPTGYGAQLAEIPRVIAATVGLRQLIALIQETAFLICNDSGPMHIAAGLGVPTITIFGWRNPAFFPLGEGHDIFCIPSEDRGNVSPLPAGTNRVDQISVAQVLSAAERKLGGAVV
jgi:ADP-heptose:LPS heptosyltransferase